MRAAGTRALAALVALALVACSPPRALEAFEVLADLAAGAGPSRLKRARPEPRRSPIAYRVEGRERLGDLYLPAGESPAALVLVPGVTPEGKDDKRLVAFAATLSRAGFTVLVPDMPRLKEQKVAPEDARDIADAIQFLAGERGGAPVGLVAISYAVGPALLAALEAEAGRRLAFVVAVGGYHDIAAVVTFFTTGYYRERPGDAWRYREPNAYGKWVFVKGNAARLEDGRDRALLEAMAARKMRDLEADIDDLVAALGPEGRAVHALLANREPDRVAALIGGLPAGVRRDLAGLDLERRDLSRLGPRLIVVHGRDDAIIPYSESVALAAAAAPERTELFLVDSLAHVELGPTGLGDGLTLWRAVYAVLAERDALAGR